MRMRRGVWLRLGGYPLALGVLLGAAYVDLTTPNGGHTAQFTLSITP
jgi:hypothetical protein